MLPTPQISAAVASFCLKHLLCVCLSGCPAFTLMPPVGGSRRQRANRGGERKKKTAGSSGVPEGLSVDLLHSFIVLSWQVGSVHCGGACLEDGSVRTKFGNEPVTSHYLPITWELLPQDRKLQEEGNKTAWHQVGLQWLFMQFLESKLKIATFARNVLCCMSCFG